MAETLKQKIVNSLEKLPQDASLDEIMEHIYFIHKVETGLEQSRRDEIIDHEEVLKRIEQW